jgi:tripeptide aminopeptidase
VKTRPEADPTETENVEQILESLPEIRDATQAAREIILANLLMIGEIPAPTFGETRRARFMQNRFTESGLHNSSSDGRGNALGILPGSQEDRNILLVAHMDTIFPPSVDHAFSVQADQIRGPGVGDNALGLAAVLTLPVLLELLDLRLRSNLILMGSARSLGRGNLEGLHFFLSKTPIPIQAGLCIEGIGLGRLSYQTIGMLRGEIVCSVPEEYDWTRFGASGAIVTLNEVINGILEIPLPKRPRTTIVLGSVEGGQSFNVIATKAILRFEIRSESHSLSSEIYQQIQDIVADVSTHSGSNVAVEIFARRRPGGIPFAHPLARHARTIMKELNIESYKSPSTSELAAFIERGIPAITIGITHGEHQNQLDETIVIEPIFTGLAQLIGILLCIDRGHCDEH